MTGRTASPQAWRRLRRHVRDSELRDVAADIAAVIQDDAGPGELDIPSAELVASIYHALAGVPWDRMTQR